MNIVAQRGIVLVSTSILLASIAVAISYWGLKGTLKEKEALTLLQALQHRSQQQSLKAYIDNITPQFDCTGHISESHELRFIDKKFNLSLTNQGNQLQASAENMQGALFWSDTRTRSHSKGLRHYELNRNRSRQLCITPSATSRSPDSCPVYTFNNSFRSHFLFYYSWNHLFEQITSEMNAASITIHDVQLSFSIKDTKKISDADALKHKSNQGFQLHFIDEDNTYYGTNWNFKNPYSRWKTPGGTINPRLHGYRSPISIQAQAPLLTQANSRARPNIVTFSISHRLNRQRGIRYNNPYRTGSADTLNDRFWMLTNQGNRYLQVYASDLFATEQVPDDTEHGTTTIAGEFLRPVVTFDITKPCS